MVNSESALLHGSMTNVDGRDLSAPAATTIPVIHCRSRVVFQSGPSDRQELRCPLGSFVW
jgi:hypothetical protein